MKHTFVLQSYIFLVDLPPADITLNASLYSLNTLEIIDGNCECHLEDNIGVPELKCSWMVDDYFKYISVAMSAFSIANMALENGYLELYKHLSKSKLLFLYGFGLVNIIYGSTISIYHLYLVGISKTSWYSLLLVPLIFRIMPLDVSWHILAKTFPILKQWTKELNFFPKKFQMPIRVICLFWFIGFMCGLESTSKTMLTTMQDLFGNANDFPLRQAFPSIELKSNSFSFFKGFDQYKSNGWINENIAPRVVPKLYPQFYGSHANDKNTIIMAIRQVAFYESSVSGLRLMLGNYRILDYLGKCNMFLITEFFSTLVLSSSLIILSQETSKEKVMTLIILFLQIIPIGSYLLELHSSLIVGLASMIVILSFMIFVITKCAIASCQKISKTLGKLINLSLYFLFVSLPLALIGMMANMHLHFNQVYDEFTDYCQRSFDAHYHDVEFITEPTLDKELFLLSHNVLTKEQMAFIKNILKLNQDLYEANFLSVFANVNGPVLVVSSLIPLLVLIALDSFNAKVVSTQARFKCCFTCFMVIASLSLFLFSEKPRFWYFWDWQKGKMSIPNYNQLIRNYRYDSSVELCNSMEKEWKDLYTINVTALEFGYNQVRKRFGHSIHNLFGLKGCGYMSMMHPSQNYNHQLLRIHQTISDFRSQYLKLSKYNMYNEIYYLMLAPAVIFVATFL